MSKKKIPEKSRLAKKALTLVEKINTHYLESPTSDLSSYSFLANKYRISFVFGIALMLYGIYSLKDRNTPPECVNKDGVLKNISNTVSDSAQSLGVLYNLYKEGGIGIVSEFSKIKNNNKNQKIHISFSESENMDQNNALVCGEKFTAKIGIIGSNQGQSIEYKEMDLVAGEEIEGSRNLSNVFLQLSENDNVSAIFDDKDSGNHSTVVYISEIKPKDIHLLGFYDTTFVYEGVGSQVNCGDKILIKYRLYNISENKIIHKEKKIHYTTEKLPILLERVLIGKAIGSKIKVITKLSNLCIFRDGNNYDLCIKFWEFEENKMDSVISLILNIDDIKDK